MTDQLFPIFLQALFRISPLTPAACAALSAMVNSCDVLAQQHLLRAGDIARNCIYIQTGLVREYYVDRNGKEATRRFCGAGEFSGFLADLLSQTPAEVFIETLEPCRILELEWAAVDDLSQVHPSLMLLMRRFAEGLYVHKMRREFEMLTLNATERYTRFSHSMPGLEARLPRHMVASYLGITPVHLSRIAGSERSRATATAQPGRR